MSTTVDWITRLERLRDVLEGDNRTGHIQWRAGSDRTNHGWAHLDVTIVEDEPMGVLTPMGVRRVQKQMPSKWECWLDVRVEIIRYNANPDEVVEDLVNDVQDFEDRILADRQLDDGEGTALLVDMTPNTADFDWSRLRPDGGVAAAIINISMREYA